MEVIKEVLLRASKGKTVDAVSRELSIRKSTLQAMLEFILKEGYLEEINNGGNCAACPMKCRTSMNVKIYRLTNKGKEYIAAEASSP